MLAEPIDALVLALLNEVPVPWHVEELEQELGTRPAVRDAVARLVAGRMIHRIGGDFVFASACGRYSHALTEATP
jgi:hypothetical protein